MIINANSMLAACFHVSILLYSVTATSGLNLVNDAPESCSNETNQLNITQLLLNRFQNVFQDDLRGSNNDQQPSLSDFMNETFWKQLQLQPQSTLETRKIDQDQRQKYDKIEYNKRNYFKILDRVFSRVELPSPYRVNNQRNNFKGGHCGLHIGCIEEIPNFPSLLKKPNVTSSFTIYTRDNFKSGIRIAYEPIVHYQLQDLNSTIDWVISDEDKSKFLDQSSTTANNRNRKKQTANSWKSATKITHSQEYPFDLSLIEQSGFNSSQVTRIIVGGYFAKEDEEWIDEVVRQWHILDPSSNIIKVSWADANRGLYHTAAYNSRIVGRQLSLFLYYLDHMFDIDLDKFHLVGHSLGAHIAGFVGSDNEGRIARITGLDPAGPIFVELNASMRLDQTDAKFVDVVHTNGGTITKGALGMSIPSGHVDYYCNGGSLQPGCYFSSVTKSIMDPVERVACSHRRSYRYFIEIIKMTISEMPSTMVNNNDYGNSTSYSIDGQTNDAELRAAISATSHLPRAFLFEAKPDDLVKLTQPELVLLSATTKRSSNARDDEDAAPAKHHLEFHLLKPQFPVGKRGLYFFKTRPEQPFFASKQYALTFRTDTVIRRKIAIMAKIDQTMVAEVELDEIPNTYTLTFAPGDSKLINLNDLDSSSRPSRIPQLHLMWKHRSFNLLLNQQNELRLNSIELSLLDTDEDQQPIIRYGSSYLPPPQPLTSSHSSFLKSGFNGSNDLTLYRNQWHRLEGKVIKNK